MARVWNQGGFRFARQLRLFSLEQSVADPYPDRESGHRVIHNPFDLLTFWKASVILEQSGRSLVRDDIEHSMLLRDSTKTTPNNPQSEGFDGKG